MRPGDRRIVRAYLLSIGVWCTLSLLGGLQYHLFDKDLNVPISLFVRIALAESRGLAIALLTPPIFWMVGRYAAAGKQSLGYLVYTAVLGPFMVLYACMLWVMHRPWQAAVQRYLPRAANGPFELIRSGFADQITTYIAIIVAAHAYLYFERVRKQELERYEFQQALAASELQALRMQLHPHFLFNTLNGISTLIDSDGECAKAMIVKLSGLLRTALKHGESDLIALQEELKFTGEYLDLEKMRLGPRLTVTWCIAPETRAVLVPQLILQPLVENAIRHGIGSSRERGWVEISSRKEGSAVELRVRNSVGAAAQSRGSGVGLQNTEARLRCLYAEEAALRFELGKDRIATATVNLPALGLKETAIGRAHEPAPVASPRSCAS